MSVQYRRKYDPDFKRNAVLLSQEEGRTGRGSYRQQKNKQELNTTELLFRFLETERADIGVFGHSRHISYGTRFGFSS